MHQFDLGDLGWDPEHAGALEAHQTPARVAAEHRGQFSVHAEQGELRVRVPGRFRYEGVDVAVGDWVALADDAVIQAVLPRRSAILRNAAGLTTTSQTLAANVDIAFVVTSLGPDLEPRRLERYLVTVWESGASPEIVLTKADRMDDPWELVASGTFTATLALPSLPEGATATALSAWLPALSLPGPTLQR